MRTLKYFQRLLNVNKVTFWIIASFLMWAYMFRGWLTNRLVLTSDALAYYEHFEYYINNLARGVFPFWEHNRQFGVPVEFFLRRIGSFNPFVFFMVLLVKLGMPFLNSYMVFLALYYFLGMVGFFQLAKTITGDERVAFAAYVLLMFSSLGTRLFDSYLLLTVIPMIWFFYFLVSFFQQHKRYQLLGMTFTGMILFTTYIPFYFITIVLTFFMVYGIVYVDKLRLNYEGLRVFCTGNKLFTAFCLTVFLLSLIPGASFYIHSKKNDLVIPMRNYGYTESLEQGKELAVDPFQVKLRTITQWGIEEDIAFTKYFSNPQDFRFALLFLPVFAYIVLIIGAFVRINRKILFLFLWGILILLISSPRLTAVYNFLYEHVFYYKYFRNLHFFLWMVILPLFIIFVVEQFRSFMESWDGPRALRAARIALVVSVHAGILIFFIQAGNLTFNSAAAIVLNLLFFILNELKLLKFNFLFLGLLLLTMILQPLEIYGYLAQNADQFDHRKEPPYRYYTRKDYLIFDLPKTDKIRPVVKKVPVTDLSLPEGVKVNLGKRSITPQSYVDVRWSTLVRDLVDTNVWDNYLRSSILLFSSAKYFDDQADPYLSDVEKFFMQNEDVALVSDRAAEKQQSPQNINAHPQSVTRDSSDVKVTGYDINYLNLSLQFASPKFLVYTDSYYNGWHAYLDGREVPIYRANVAFKGVWVPEGHHVLYFRFGTVWDRLANYFFIMLFFGVFLFLGWLWKKEKVNNALSGMA